MSETRKSFCRLCHAYCGYELTVENDRIVHLKGDKSDPLSKGYACFKGLKSIEMYHHPKRLLGSLKKEGETFIEVSADSALAEAGEKLRNIVQQNGPDSVGFFIGTQALFNSLSPVFVGALAAALKTPKIFKTMTIDQSAKWIGEARMGTWQAGALPFDEADVWMMVGANPMNTMVAAGGPHQFVFSNPAEKMRRAKQQGMQLIVIDPRRTETAELADLHLQIVPGSDTELAAALLHIIFRENWIDQSFCDEFVDGLNDLRRMVQPFSPENVAPLVGVPEEEIELAAAMFARDNKRGMIGTGTGPNMARFSNTSEHLFQAINVVCGRYPRAGESVSNTGVLMPAPKPIAQVVAPNREWITSPKTAAHGLGTLKNSMMSAEIADEILVDSPNRLRALIVVGGNLQTALPDQAKAELALGELDLLLVIDPVLSGTAQLADYVIAPKLHYERADNTAYLEMLYPKPFAHATQAVVPPPEGSDIIDDWYAFWHLARGCGVQLNVAGMDIDMQTPPSTEELLELWVKHSNIPYSDVEQAAGGQLFHGNEVVVAERNNDVRFDLCPEDVANEIKQVESELKLHTITETPESEFQLIVRRQKDVMNSTGTLYPSVSKRYAASPIYINPADIEFLQLKEGDEVVLFRDNKKVGGKLKADDSLRQGTIAMTHGWSGRSTHPNEATNRLVDADKDVADINRMPVMTGFRVSVRQA